MCLHSFIFEEVPDPSVGGRFSVGTCVSVPVNKARRVIGAEESGIAGAEVHPIRRYVRKYRWLSFPLLLPGRGIC